MKEPHIQMQLAKHEWQHIATPINSSGGFQDYLHSLQEQAKPLPTGGAEFTFNKLQFGDLLFHMIYGWKEGGGGYQGRLRKAFSAAINRRIGHG